MMSGLGLIVAVNVNMTRCSTCRDAIWKIPVTAVGQHGNKVEHHLLLCPRGLTPMKYPFWQAAMVACRDFRNARRYFGHSTTGQFSYRKSGRPDSERKR